jgi:hypothetical protein
MFEYRTIRANLRKFKMNARASSIFGLVSLVLAGCGNHAGLDAAAQTSSEQMQRSAAIGNLVQNYEQARAAHQWDLALSYADQLQRLAPDSALASHVQATLADTSAHAEQTHDKAHLAGLWSYNVVVASESDGSDGVLSTASIDAESKADAPGDGKAPRLVLRDHPKWGHSVNLVLDQGQFDCPSSCTVSVQFDDHPARPFAASKAQQGGQALAITDEQAIRSALDKVRVLTIAASVDGKPRALSFAVGGFDRVRLERKMQ